MNIDEQYIEQIKKDGFRPCILAGLICDKKVGLFRSDRYPGYEFVQGGIELEESPADAILREVREEAGESFYQACQFPPESIDFLFETKMEMKIKERVKTLSGDLIRPRGKHYLIYAVRLASVDHLPMIDTREALEQNSSVKFHSCKWCNSTLANKLVNSISNPIKREIARRSIQLLAESNAIQV